MVKEQYPEAAKTVAQQVLPTWLSILEEIVSQDCAGSIIDTLDRQTGQALALHEQAWKTFVTATHFGSHIKPRLQMLLSRALSTLHALQAAFERIHVYPSADIDFPDDGTFFATPSTLAARIVNFVGVLLQKASFRSTLDSTSLSTFVLLLRSYSRITATEEEEWLDNVAEFVAAGDDDELGALSSSLRSRCADVLGETMSVKPAELLTALSVACSVAHQQGQDKRAQAQTGWWKEEEASLSFVGGQAENVMEKLDEEAQATKSFDIESLFSMSVMPYMDTSTPAFLYGRCFVFASQFSPILPTHLANAFLDAAVMAMEDSSNVGREGDDIVKLSAVRCVKNFHRHLDESVVQPYAARILGRLAPLLDNDNEDLIVLITETLQAVAAQRDAQQSHIPAHIYGEIAVACIKAWAKQSNMRAVQMVVDDLLEQFASQKNEDTVLSTLQGSVPCLAQLLGQETNGPRSDTGTLVEGVLGFASALTRGANADALNQAHIIDALLPPLFTILHATDDREIYQSAAELLGDLLDKLPESFCAWSDAQGINAPQHTLNLVSRMIAPNDSYESGGLAPGNLLTALLRKQPQSISSSLPDICRTLVARLATSLTPSLTQSMVVPLAYLMKDHIETVVELLLTHTVASADGTAVNAMEILLRKWVEFAPSVQGFWHERVSALGLCAVWNAGTTNSNLLTLINTVLVDGDMIPDKSDVIKTRSRAKTMPDQFTQVPLSAKIIKVLLGEYKEATDGPPHNSGAGANSTDDDDGDQEWDDDEDDFDADLDSKRFLSDLLGEDVDDELSQLVHKHDQDKFGSDAIWNMPYRVSVDPVPIAIHGMLTVFQSYLTTFFQRWAQDIQVASAVTAHLNAKEVGLLQSAVA